LGNFSVANRLDHVQDLGPRWEGPAIIFLVLFQCHYETELLYGHLAFFGGSSVVAATAPWTAAAVHLHAALGEMAAVTTFKLDLYLPALETRAAIHHISAILTTTVFLVARQLLFGTLAVRAMTTIYCVIHVCSLGLSHQADQLFYRPKPPES
jgi:hypothetical protein